MVEIAVNQVVMSIAGMVATGLLGFLLGKLKRLTKVERARIVIEKASARAHILAAYELYIVKGKHMTIARYDELNEEYEAYITLGGNGTAKRYMQEIRALKPYLVIE